MERITDELTINVAAPISGPSGQANGVVFAAIELRSLSRPDSEVSLPRGTVINTVDRNGVILMQFPAEDGLVGQDHHKSPIVQQALTSSSLGVTRGVGLDGVDRLLSYAPISEDLDRESPMVIVGIPAGVAFADLDRALVWNLIILSLVSIFAVSGAWMMGDIFFLRRIRLLAQTAGRLATGDLNARSGLARAPEK